MKFETKEKKGERGVWLAEVTRKLSTKYLQKEKKKKCSAQPYAEVDHQGVTHGNLSCKVRITLSIGNR